MKKILFFTFTALPFLANAQVGNYDIKGKIGNLNAPAKVYLWQPLKGRDVADSALLSSGSFEFKGNIKEPVRVVLMLNKTGTGLREFTQNLKWGVKIDFLDFYIEGGDILISGTDSVKTAKISGSKLNDDNSKLAAAIKIVLDKIALLNNEYQKTPEADRPKLDEKHKALQNEEKAVFRKFIQQNPASYVSLDAFNSFEEIDWNYDEVMSLFSVLAPAIQNSGHGKAAKAALEADKAALDKLKATDIGSIAPDLIQNDPTGKPVSLSSFKGKYVLLEFWTSWCEPCHQENVNLVKVYNQYKTKNFTILGVSTDGPKRKDAWLKAIKDEGLAWGQVSDLQWENKAAALYNVDAVPQNYLIDPAGKIIAKDLHGEDLKQTLAKLLK